MEANDREYSLDTSGINEFDLLFNKDSPQTWLPAVFHLVVFNYNSIDFVDDFLESIHNQTLARFDIFLVDLGSTDGSWDKLKKWVPRAGIVSRTMKAEGFNPFDAINKACYVINTLQPRAYMCPVNISDRLTPGALRNYFSYAQREPHVDLFYANFKIVDDKKHENVIGYQNWPEYSLVALLNENLCGCSPMIKLKSFIDMGLYDSAFTYTADYALYLKMSAHNLNFYRIEEVIGSHYEGVTLPLVLDEYNDQVVKLQEGFRKHPVIP